ncbi:variable surface protein [Plasmodium gonderi]|uniref:Variable surface protein n=1 Tax=Plasmodium gonderi TaxID=77519 RepID=A0A1Y1JP55_PLAGO|nr:variable surface protein [Plasmodium gonderi]GAW84020.1 variable surface protein [Plasmodium gonderi]
MDLSSIENCEKIHETIKKITNSCDDKMCHQSMSYLNDIHIKDKHNVTWESACKYMYYWIYNYLLNNQYTENITKIYNGFINTYKSIFQVDIYVNYEETSITEEELNKLTAIYNIYTYLNKVQGNDGSYTDNKFFDTLQNIINEHNPDTINQFTEELRPHESSPCKMNNLFTPYISWLHRKIIKKGNQYNNIGEEKNIFHPFEISWDNSRISKYNILYPN